MSNPYPQPLCTVTCHMRDRFNFIWKLNKHGLYATLNRGIARTYIFTYWQNVLIEIINCEAEYSLSRLDFLYNIVAKSLWLLFTVNWFHITLCWSRSTTQELWWEQLWYKIRLTISAASGTSFCNIFYLYLSVANIFWICRLDAAQVVSQKLPHGGYSLPF